MEVNEGKFISSSGRKGLYHHMTKHIIILTMMQIAIRYILFIKNIIQANNWLINMWFLI